MNRMAGAFMKAAVVYALIGFAIGMVMGASHSFELRSVHSHLNLVGWASMAVYAIFYQLVPSAGRTAVAKVQFWAANAGLVILSASLALIATKTAAADPGAAIGSLVTLASFALFAYIVFTTPGRQAQE